MHHVVVVLCVCFFGGEGCGGGAGMGLVGGGDGVGFGGGVGLCFGGTKSGC